MKYKEERQSNEKFILDYHLHCQYFVLFFNYEELNCQRWFLIPRETSDGKTCYLLDQKSENKKNLKYFIIILQVFYILCATFDSCCTILTPSRAETTDVSSHLYRLFDIIQPHSNLYNVNCYNNMSTFVVVCFNFFTEYTTSHSKNLQNISFFT